MLDRRQHGFVLLLARWGCASFEFLRLNIVLGARASTTSSQREAGLWAVTWDGSDGHGVGWWRGRKVASFLSCTWLH